MCDSGNVSYPNTFPQVSPEWGKIILIHTLEEGGQREEASCLLSF